MELSIKTVALSFIAIVTVFFFSFAVAESEDEIPVVPAAEGTALVAAGAPLSVQEKVALAFPDAPVMSKVAYAESRFDPHAKNPHSTATGVFQILIGTWNAYECEGIRMDAEDNIACARKIYDAEGTRPWQSSGNW